jgi:hypothetical protein
MIIYCLHFCSRLLGRVAGGSEWFREDGGREDGGVDLSWVTIPALFNDGPIKYLADIIDL